MLPIGHVVKEGKVGNTTYRFCDDAYRDRTPEEIQQTLRNIEQIGRNILIKRAKKEAGEIK